MAFVTALTTAPEGGGGTNLMWPNAIVNGDVLWVAYISGEGYPSVLRWDIAAGTGTETQLDGVTDIDTHSQPAILRLADASFIAVWTIHNDDIFCAISADGSTWGAAANITSQVGTYTGTMGYTYPMLWQDAGGDVHLLVRRGGAFVPGTYYIESVSTDGGSTWSSYDTIYEGYYAVMHHASGRVDISTRWNSSEDGPVCHAYYDGTDWHQTDGTAITADPFDDADMTEVATYTATHRVLSLDIAPGPVIAMLRWKTSDGSEATYQYARWDGSAWVVTDIVASGTTGITKAGISIDRADPTVVYVARIVSGLSRIYRYRTTDAGATWTGEELAASADDETYPMVPVAAPVRLPVVWLTGDWTAADDFDQGISAYLATFGPSSFGAEVGINAPTFTVEADRSVFPARYGVEVGFREGLRFRTSGRRQVMLTGGGIETPEMTTGGTTGQKLTFDEAGPPTWEDDTGGTPATTVESETTWGITPAVGTDTEYARQDHTHGTPANPVTAAAISALGFVGPLLISDTPSTPLVFADLIQNEAQDDLVYADP